MITEEQRQKEIDFLINELLKSDGDTTLVQLANENHKDFYNENFIGMLQFTAMFNPYIEIDESEEETIYYEPTFSDKDRTNFPLIRKRKLCRSEELNLKREKKLKDGHRLDIDVDEGVLCCCPPDARLVKDLAKHTIKEKKDGGTVFGTLQQLGYHPMVISEFLDEIHRLP